MDSGKPKIKVDNQQIRCMCRDYDLIWGAKVTCEFRKKVVEICEKLWPRNPLKMANNLMAVFAWESGGTFKADVPNRKNSGATGLIQFMPDTAKGLLNTEVTIEIVKNYYNSQDKNLQNLKRVKEFAQMSEVQQLEYVEKYFKKLENKDLEFVDFYLQVLFPASSGVREHVVFADDKNKLSDKNDKHASLRVNKYNGNSGLDINGDGKIYKAEIAEKTKYFLEDGAISANKDLIDRCCLEEGKTVTPYQNATHTANKEKNKKIIVIDPGHGIVGNQKVKANGGTQIRLLKLKKSFGNKNFIVGQNYSWKDLSDEIINKADEYFEFIDVKDPRSPTEFEYVYDRALELKELFENDGHIVYLTRDKKETIDYTDIPSISSCKNFKITTTSPLTYRKLISNSAKADYFISLHCDGIENLKGNYAVMCYFDDNDKKLAEKIAKNYSQVTGKVEKRIDLTVLGNGGKNDAKYKVLVEFGFMTTPKIAKKLVNNSKIIVNDLYKSLREHINEN